MEWHALVLHGMKECVYFESEDFASGSFGIISTSVLSASSAEHISPDASCCVSLGWETCDDCDKTRVLLKL
jgi:hypothetical protein